MALTIFKIIGGIIIGKYRIEREDASLYAYSNSAVPWLKELLLNGKSFPCLTMKEFKKLDVSKQELINSNFRTDLNNVIPEWSITCDGLQENELPELVAEKYSKVKCCELCGNTNITYIYIITNCTSGKNLFVGSSCIIKYDQIRDANEKDATVLKKENAKKRLTRNNEEKILQKRPNILNLIRRFRNFDVENKFLLNEDLYRKLDKLKEQLLRYNKIIVQKNIDDKKIQELVIFSDDLERFFKVYDIYILNSSKDDFGITEEITRYCNAHLQNDSILSKIKKYGKIPFEAIVLIKEPVFMSKMIRKFENLLNKNGIVLVNRNIGKSFSYALSNEIIFETCSNDFIVEYLDYIKDVNLINKIDFYKLINKSEISNKSYSKALSLIDFSGLNKHGLKQVFSDTKIGEISFKCKNSFYVVDYKSFINLFKHQLANEKFGESDYKIMAKYIIKIGIEYSYLDYRDHLKRYEIDIKNVI